LRKIQSPKTAQFIAQIALSLGANGSSDALSTQFVAEEGAAFELDVRLAATNS
jgi:hypothetical protein